MSDSDRDSTDTFTLIKRRLRELVRGGKLTWPLNGRNIAELIRQCVIARRDDIASSETARIMRMLREQGVLKENALGTDWYLPGPNFND